MFDAYLAPESVEMFTKTGVLSKVELEARNEVKWEMYTKKIQIEARVLGDLALNHIIPVATRYQSTLVENLVKLRELLGERGSQIGAGDLEAIEKISTHIDVIRKTVHEMVEARKKANAMTDEREKAIAYHDNVVPGHGNNTLPHRQTRTARRQRDVAPAQISRTPVYQIINFLMDALKHECGVAMIRLRKPLAYYRQKYGSYSYGLDRLYLLMEKQHNRGQEAAGIGVVKLNACPGEEYVYRERALGTGAIDEIFARVGASIPSNLHSLPAEEVDHFTPFVGQVYMGHLRYSTTGRSGMEYTHPFLRRNNWRSRALLLCGNFNMTNVDTIFKQIVSTGQHPRLYSDTVLLLEQIGNSLDKENHRIYRKYRDDLVDPELSHRIEDELDMGNVIAEPSRIWDGGYTICGTTGSGSSFVLRDPKGIRRPITISTTR